MQTELELAVMRANEAQRLYVELVERHQQLEHMVVEMKQAINLLWLAIPMPGDDKADELNNLYHLRAAIAVMKKWDN